MSEKDLELLLMFIEVRLASIQKNMLKASIGEPIEDDGDAYCREVLIKAITGEEDE